jgi:voltage-gated sodium channel
MGIVRPVMEVFPYAWAFFVPFILVATFTMLNLFIAIIVNSMQSIADDVARERSETATEEVKTFTHADHMELLTELRALRSEVQDLKGR